jgi:hypothetical protein
MVHCPKFGNHFGGISHFDFWSLEVQKAPYNVPLLDIKLALST